MEQDRCVEVVAALIGQEGRFLICQRPAHKARGLLWEFAGGKVEPGETKEQALVRECREELAVTLEVGAAFADVVHEYPDIRVHLTLFNAVIAEGAPQLLEHRDIRWITAGEIDDYTFCPADTEILAKLSSEDRCCPACPVISVDNMRQSDAWTIQNLTPSLELMHRAAMGIYRAADWGTGKRIGIVIGSGNNGGDGAALACILAENGIPSTVYRVSQKASPDSAHYLQKAQALGVPVLPFAQAQACDILVDCLLGTGFTGSPRGDVRQAIQWINRAGAAGATVISADINSGLDGDTGAAELAVVSDLTVSIGYFKTGMFRGDGPKYIRRLVNADIGIRLAQKQQYTLIPAGRMAGPGEIVCPPYCRPAQGGGMYSREEAI